ncbi:uncharacterized protein [Dermacentor albipictus]|uniref:uncharacterized protein isoform X2 n=1 Tax=Dermacentor albipictus TaxID=60249 RepID=UPI0031FC514F
MAKESSDSDHDDDVYFSRQLPIIDPDMLQDVLCILAKQNDEAVREPEEYLDHLSPSNTVELLFQTCAKLELPICVQITAVEYLDRFLVQHVRDLRKQLGLPSACAAVSWDSVVGRMREQVMLRMLSCIQIASKMFSSVKFHLCPHWTRTLVERQKRYMVAYTPSLSTIYEEGGPTSGGEGSASGSSQRLVTFPKRARYDGRPCHRPPQPRSDDVRICIEDVRGRRSSTTFVGNVGDSRLFVCAIVLGVVGFVVLCLGAVEALRSHDTPGNFGRLLMFVGATLLMTSITFCCVLPGSTRSAAVKLVHEAHPS